MIGIKEMGRQVAINKGYHYKSEVFEDDNGDYYVVVIQDSNRTLFKREYYPAGNRMLFPKKWGKKRGAVTLLNHLIESDEILLKKTEERLNKLKACKLQVDMWLDDFQNE